MMLRCSRPHSCALLHSSGAFRPRRKGTLEGPAGEQTFDAPDGQEAAPSFGLETELLELGASSFSAQDDAAQRYYSSGYIYSSAGDGAFWAPVTLPAGSVVTQTCVWLYDSTANDILVEWGGYSFETDGDNPLYFEIQQVYNNTAAGYHNGCLNTDYTIRYYHDRDSDGDSERINYRIAVYLAETTNAHRLGAAQVAWKRQVSPAPASATFADVPVGSFGFKHVEALAASGITAGCGGGNFCPTNTLTRVEMAIFLAKPLGLHYPY